MEIQYIQKYFNWDIKEEFILKDLIPRINELAKKSKTVGLNEEEKKEQEVLRKKYLEAFRGNFIKTIENVKVVDEDGNDVTPQKLKDQKSRNKKPLN